MKAPARRRLSEDDLHYQAADYLRLAWPEHLLFFHVPNGGLRDQVERIDRKTGRKYWFSPTGAKLKRFGALAGVPDLAFILPNAQAAFIELKADDGDLSDDQRDFIAKAQPLGAVCVVCRTLQCVIDTTTKWLAAFGLKPRITITDKGGLWST